MELLHELEHESEHDDEQESEHDSPHEVQHCKAQSWKPPIIAKTIKIPAPITSKIGKVIAKTPIKTRRLRLLFLASSSSIRLGSIELSFGTSEYSG